MILMNDPGAAPGEQGPAGSVPRRRLTLSDSQRFWISAGLVGALLLGGMAHDRTSRAAASRRGDPGREAESVPAPGQRPIQAPDVRPRPLSIPREFPRPAKPKLRRPDALAKLRAGLFLAASQRSILLAAATAPKETGSLVLTNLVKNPSFEDGTSGWTSFGGSTIRRIDGGFHGEFALEMRGTTRRALFGIQDGLGWVPRTAAAGSRYRASVWVRSVSHKGRAVMRIHESVKDVRIGTMAYASVVLSPAWQLLSVEYVTQREGSRLDLQILDDPMGPGEVFQTDNIAILMVPKTPPPGTPGAPDDLPHGDPMRPREPGESTLKL